MATLKATIQFRTATAGVYQKICSRPLSFNSTLTKDGVYRFCLEHSREVGKNTKVLRFQLPQTMPTLSHLPIPSGVKVLREKIDINSKKIIRKEKSYSPISLPDNVGSFDLLVKSYPCSDDHDVNGSFGYELCNLKIGEFVSMKLKPPRKIHGDENVINRWDHIGFISGGTGIAPFIQIVRTLLQHPTDSTQLTLLNINQSEQDILMKIELDELVTSSNGRFTIINSLTQPSSDWHGTTGRGNVEMIKEYLPKPFIGGSNNRSNIMIMVCGKDGFVETCAGSTNRVVEGGKKWKEQGPLQGLLYEAGFDQSQVYKF